MFTEEKELHSNIKEDDEASWIQFTWVNFLFITLFKGCLEILYFHDLKIPIHWKSNLLWFFMFIYL